MKKTKRQEQALVSQEPKWWKKYIVAPIIVGIILSVVGLGIWIVQKSSEERYGKLRIVSNVDSARIFLTKEFKGYTLVSKAIEISSLEPGSYVLSVEKDSFTTFFDQNVEITAGKIASVRADLKFEQTPKSAVTDSASAKPVGTMKSYLAT
jgi:hypothetical protein